MRTRGRTSAAASEVTLLEEIPRPDAPYDLTDEQVLEWRAVVNRMPADWFPRETYPLLTEYCRHVVMARKVALLVAALEVEAEIDVKQYNQLARMAERESRTIAMLATKMRISQQTTYDKSKKKPVLRQKNPWEA